MRRGDEVLVGGGCCRVGAEAESCTVVECGVGITYGLLVGVGVVGDGGCK